MYKKTIINMKRRTITYNLLYSELIIYIYNKTILYSYTSITIQMSVEAHEIWLLTELLTVPLIADDI